MKINFTLTDSIYRLADCVELYVIYTGQHLSRAKLIALMNEDDTDVSKIDSIFSELTRRTYLYGENRPIELNGNIVKAKIRWDTLPEYTMCLIYSYYGVQDVADGGTKLFERLVSEVLEEYIGGKAITTGHPFSLSIEQQIEFIVKECNELKGGRLPEPHDKDRGVDNIAWKSHNDNRSNQIFILMQCAAGIYWRKKKSIPLRAWTQFIHFGVTPIPGLAIPQVIQQSKWNNILDEYNLVFDRIRIFRLLILRKEMSDKSLRNEILKWITDILK